MGGWEELLDMLGGVRRTAAPASEYDQAPRGLGLANSTRDLTDYPPARALFEGVGRDMGEPQYVHERPFEEIGRADQGEIYGGGSSRYYPYESPYPGLGAHGYPMQSMMDSSEYLRALLMQMAKAAGPQMIRPPRYPDTIQQERDSMAIMAPRDWGGFSDGKPLWLPELRAAVRQDREQSIRDNQEYERERARRDRLGE